MSACFLSGALVRELIVEAERWSPQETGGILLGVADDTNIWVEEVVGPGPNALHSRGTFVPDADYQEAQIAAAYERSGRRIYYLGDWHTHPGQSVLMSRRDRRTLRSIARWQPSRQPRPVMAILGGLNEWQMVVWRYLPRRSAWWNREKFEAVKTIDIA